MIPKIIHLCWLSGDSYPPLIQKCIESWKKYLPDYEIWVWDTKRFDVNSVLWTKQAFEAKKYAFAADYIRLYALYHFGGIYLDSDVLVYKSFDDLLKLPYFIGEDYIHLFEPAIIGCEPNTPWIGRVMERYRDRPFIMEDGAYDMKTLPLVFRQELAASYIFNKIEAIKEFSYDNGLINIFRCDFFNGRDYIGAVKFPNSYCSHCFNGSWAKEEHGIMRRIRKYVPRTFVNIYYYYRYQRISLNNIQIPFVDKNDLLLNRLWRNNSVSL